MSLMYLNSLCPNLIIHGSYRYFSTQLSSLDGPRPAKTCLRACTKHYKKQKKKKNKKKKKKKKKKKTKQTTTTKQTHLFKYIENFTSNNFICKKKTNSDTFLISAQNIDCGYSLEPPRRGGSNEYPQSILSS